MAILIRIITTLIMIGITPLAWANPFEGTQLNKIGGNFAHPWGITLLDVDTNNPTALVTERGGRLFTLDLHFWHAYPNPERASSLCPSSGRPS